MNMLQTYIIIDDDEFSNFLCKTMIIRTLGDIDIKTFTVPEDGLDFIQTEYENILLPTIILLDINMPTLTGWEFVDKFQEFGKSITEQIVIYIVSSSVDQRDKDKAAANKYIKGFLSKPLKAETILSIAGA